MFTKILLEKLFSQFSSCSSRQIVHKSGMFLNAAVQNSIHEIVHKSGIMFLKNAVLFVRQNVIESYFKHRSIIRLLYKNKNIFFPQMYWGGCESVYCLSKSSLKCVQYFAYNKGDKFGKSPWNNAYHYEDFRIK